MMKRILLIATGGTIASLKTDSGLAPGITSEELLSYVPDAKTMCEIDTVQTMNLDSTNIKPEHWLKLTETIEQSYDDYDGFVICHGTDTLAYTAAALSYLIRGTRKPIVLTGAQKPINLEDTDARKNLLDSLRFACSGESGVCIVFGGRVIAGTRARKARTKSYNAFTSINFPDLADIRDDRVIRFIPCSETEAPVFTHKLDSNVVVLKLTPGMPPETFAAVGSLCNGLIIESYGVGGIPDVYLDELDRLVKAGKTIVMATQVPQEGSDLSVYQVGQRIKERYKLLETYDMTLEATVTKLMWVLGQESERDKIRTLFYTPVNFDLLL